MPKLKTEKGPKAVAESKKTAPLPAVLKEENAPHKIWLINLDDFVGKSDAYAALKKYALKYTQILKKDDLCVISPVSRTDPDYEAYMSKIKKISNKKWIFSPKEHKEGDSFVQAVTKDKELVKTIKEYCKNGYVMIPLMYSDDFEKLSKLCNNKLFNNSKVIQQANNKLEFKKLCKEFGIKTIKPVFEKNEKETKVLCFINFNEQFLLRRPVSSGGLGTMKGTLVELLRLMKDELETGHFYIEKYKDIFRSLGSLCVLKDDGVSFVGIDNQLITKEAWEGCEYPFAKLETRILDKIKENSLNLAEYYHKKGVRGQVNFDWAVIIKDGALRLRALECNSRYNGFGLCLRLAQTVYGIGKDELHFYMDSKISVSKKLTTKKVIDIIEAINAKLPFKGGILLQTAVRDGSAGFCFVATNQKDVDNLKNLFRKHVVEGH